MNALEFRTRLVGLVRNSVTKAMDEVGQKLSAMSDRIKALEDRPAPVDGKDGTDGQDGKDGSNAPAPTNDQVHQALLGVDGLPNIVASAVASHMKDYPPPAGADGQDGTDGQDGKDAPALTVDQVRAAVLDAPELPSMLHAAVATHLETNPPAAGKDGTDGQDGADAPAPTPEIVGAALAGQPEIVMTAVAQHLKDYPPPAGQDGQNGNDGQDGADAPAPTPEAIAAALAAQPELLAAAVATHLEAYPPKPGKDGKDADPAFVRQVAKEFMDANPAPAGQDGKDGKDGNDGTSVTLEAIEKQLNNMQASWALDFERRAMDLYQRTMDRMPVPKDGRDGVGFDNLSMEYDGERTVKFIFARGNVAKELPMRVPAIIRRGVYKKEALYEEGDVIAWAGSMWLAKCETLDKQPGTDKSWQLVVKRGNDGKDAK